MVFHLAGWKYASSAVLSAKSWVALFVVQMVSLSGVPTADSSDEKRVDEMACCSAEKLACTLVAMLAAAQVDWTALTKAVSMASMRVESTASEMVE